MNSFVLVTPVKDEEKLIGQTIGSVVAQSALPKEWIIVNDGSTDRTNDIIREWAKNHSWIRLLDLKPRQGRSFAAVTHNTLTGIRHLECKDYAFLGLLDSDVTFQPDYFEQLIRRFDTYPALGLAGGVVIDMGLPRDRFPRNRRDVPGAVQFFRRECYEAIGGLLPIPEGGWDSMTCVMARMHGYETKLFTDLVVDHHKPRNISQGGVMRRKWQMGLRDYALGYNPLFEFVKCLSRLKDRPFAIGSVAWWSGYCSAMLARRTRIVDPNVVAHMRAEQTARLRAMVGLESQANPAFGRQADNML